MVSLLHSILTVVKSVFEFQYAMNFLKKKKAVDQMIELNCPIYTLFAGGGVRFRIDNEPHCKQLDTFGELSPLIIGTAFRL